MPLNGNVWRHYRETLWTGIADVADSRRLLCQAFQSRHCVVLLQGSISGTYTCYYYVMSLLVPG